MIDIQKTSQPPTQDVHGKYPENTLFFVVVSGRLEVYLSSLDGSELSKVFGKTEADLIYAKIEDIGGGSGDYDPAGSADAVKDELLGGVEFSGNTLNKLNNKIAALGLSKVDVTDIVDALNSLESEKPLSANQGRVLKELVDSKEASLSGATTGDFLRGDKTWVDFSSTARLVTLAGLSTNDTNPIAAADSLLLALGKLQAQIATKEATIDIGTAAQYVAGNKTIRTFAVDVRATTMAAMPTDNSADVAASDTLLVAVGKLQAQLVVQRGNYDALNTSLTTAINDTAATAAQDATNKANGAIATLRAGVDSAGDTLKKLYDKLTALETVLTSNDVNLDTLQEIVDFVKNNQDALTSLGLNKVSISSIVNNLTDNSTDKPLAANQGLVLKGLIDEKEPTIATGSTSQYVSGNKSLRTFAADVRSAVMTGLSVATNAAVAATDSLLVAIGKLQAQLTAISSSISNVNNTADVDKIVASAATLKTTRNINGTAFDGSGDITTSSWGTARNLTIGGATKSVNGSGNINWPLEEIGASEIGHQHTAGEIADFSTAIDTKRTFSTQQTPSGGTLSISAGAVAWNCDTHGQVVNLTLTANATLSAPTNVVANTLYMVRVAQDATGSRTLAYNVAYKFGDAGAPVIPVTANKGHWLTFIGRPGNTMEYLGIRTGF